MNLSTPARGRSSAFTLVELLVVIGIIAVLIAILLPALNKARDQSTTIACRSNMRQLVLYTLMYASENRQTLPFCQLDTRANPLPGRGGMKSWLDHMYDVQRIPHATWQDMAAIDRMDRVGILTCPGQTGQYWSRALKKLTYVGGVPGDASGGLDQKNWICVNDIICPRNDQWQPTNPAKPSPAVKLARVKRQSQVMLVIDNYGQRDQAWAGGWDPAMQLRFRHSSGQSINLGFLDGHSETWDWRTIQDGTNPVYERNLFSMGGNVLPWNNYDAPQPWP